MSTFRIENQWGGNKAPWHPGGVWILGARDNQNVIAMHFKSTDGGQTFTGMMNYKGEGPIGLKGTKTSENTYTVENQWGGDHAPWHPGGQWVIGGRANQNVIAMSVKTRNGGLSLSGTMTYAGEGPIGMKVQMVPSYSVENQWGGNHAPWHKGGDWVLGARDNQNVVAVNIKSPDNGETFTGTMTYAGEGPIGFKATKFAQNSYTVENQWGGNNAPWHKGGQWRIGGRQNQNVIAMDVKSTDGGQSLNGTMTYAGEGPIGFKGALKAISTPV